MDRTLTSFDNAAADEDYIDIEVSSSSSSSTFLCYSINSPPHNPNREFEFQMSSTSLEIEPTTSPADELFYKGNLLPLHLPPRLQMVQKLLQNSKTDPFEDTCMTPSTPTTNTTTTTTPFESCNITPSGSSRVSRELNADEYFFECATDMKDINGYAVTADNPKKSWSKKLKLIKQSSLGSKLKASRAYLKSLFIKTRCSDETIAEGTTTTTTTKNANEETPTKTKYTKGGKKYPFGQIHRERYQVADILIGETEKEKMVEDTSSNQRRSFSLTIKKTSSTKSTSFSLSSGSGSSSSSSLSSANSNGFYEVHLLKRCNSANSEIESSIQGAIAHCKKSQQAIGLKKNVSEVGFCSFSGSRTCEDLERPGLCRG